MSALLRPSPFIRQDYRDSYRSAAAVRSARGIARGTEPIPTDLSFAQVFAVTISPCASLGGVALWVPVDPPMGGGASGGPRFGGCVAGNSRSDSPGERRKERGRGVFEDSFLMFEKGCLYGRSLVAPTTAFRTLLVEEL